MNRITTNVSIHGLLRALTEITYDFGDITYVSIHGLLRALTISRYYPGYRTRFNPRALTSPDQGRMQSEDHGLFQSTGSYEP